MIIEGKKLFEEIDKPSGRKILSESSEEKYQFIEKHSMHA